ncbi:hypothetical protein AG1IA_00839 [Rhizoctonia solani AG-1 IA]|uniref:Uncharacterized protein n=1 Tax=Thanatephorus cucumeris (strain AG1-IA) TaxID=983506 RepID=L8X7T0_THACA|nr:hypothetical protein AG1IA_00839 [Rhizoctonia solani AG-1 IA]
MSKDRCLPVALLRIPHRGGQSINQHLPGMPWRISVIVYDTVFRRCTWFYLDKG